MTLYVIDASVMLKFFAAEPERNADRAEMLLAARNAGDITLAAPELLDLEVLNVLGRKRGMSEASLNVVVDALADFSIDYVPVDARDTVPWIASGLTSYDAAYVVAAQVRRVRCVTDDSDLTRLAPDLTIPLAEFAC